MGSYKMDEGKAFHTGMIEGRLERENRAISFDSSPLPLKRGRGAGERGLWPG
jgi:hypothetical protein